MIELRVCQLGSLDSKYWATVTSEKSLLGSYIYEKKGEEAGLGRQDTKSLQAQHRALEQRLPVAGVLRWVEIARPLYHHLPQSLLWATLRREWLWVESWVWPRGYQLKAVSWPHSRQLGSKSFLEVLPDQFISLSTTKGDF